MKPKSRNQKKSPKLWESLTNNIIVNSAAESWKSFVKNIRYAPWVMLADILLIIAMGFIVGMFKAELMGSAFKIITYLGQKQELLSSLAESGTSAFQDMMSSPIFSGAYNGLLVSFYKIALFFVLAWIVLQGMSWAVSYLIGGISKTRKECLIIYMRFAAYTLAGSVLIGIITLAFIKSIFAVVFNFEATISLKGVQLINYILMAVVAYFLLVAYSALNKPVLKVLKAAVTRIYILLPMYAILLLLLNCINIIISLTAKLDMRIALALAILIILPLLILARVYAIVFTNKVVENS